MNHIEASQSVKKLAEDKFEKVIESVPSAVVIVNQLGKIILLNTQAEKLFGYNRNELIDQSVEILVPEEFRIKHSEYRNEFVSKPQARQMGQGRDLLARHKDGSLFPVEIGLSPVKTEEGLIIISAIVDITKRKKAEEKLREEKERAQKYLDVAEVMLLAINNREEVTMINQRGCKILGYKEKEVIGKNWFENFLPAQIKEQTRELFKKLISRNHENVEYHENNILTKTGEKRLISWHNTVLNDKQGKITGTLSSGVDITDKKQAEQALFESQEKLKNIIENTTDAVIVYDEKGKVMTVNKEATRLFCGNHRERLDQIWDIIPTENRDDFQEKLKNAKRGSRLLDYETENILENGERISVSVGLVYMKQEGGMFIETIRDIRERLVLRSKIVEIEKSQVMGKLAEGIAHHMGTPLASMLLRVQMLKEDIPKIGNYIDIMEKLESIERQIFYGKKVMQRLLRFARKPENVTRPENVALMIEEAVEMLNPLFKKTGIELESSMDSGLRILADVDLIGLVFSDIMTNAVDAMPEGGKIFLSVKNGTEKDMVEIIISDTGSGIPEQILPLVFEPFFSTKPAGKGTGLGLSVARRIIHDHGGEISIESIDGEGTSIRIQIPLYEEG